jgi:serine/threonine-protein kinase
MGSRTRTGALLGTPAYMSPEQVKSPRDVDPRSDLWSAGVMTWEMLTGRVAFPAPTEYARLSAVVSLTPDTLEKVDPALAPISPIVERAMQKDPARRFSSAMEMVRALSAIASSITATDTSRTNPTPLSRLPAVPSLFAPVSVGISPGASSERHTPVAAEHGAVPPRQGSGTLQSATPMAQINTPLPPRVVVIDPPQGSTMPSHDLPILEAPGSARMLMGRGVAAWIVVILVVAALGAGFMLGFAVARSM